SQGVVQSRMSLVRDALKSLVLTDLVDHNGIINIALIGFSTTASVRISVADLTSGNVQGLLDQIDLLVPTNSTNYDNAFKEATTWFGTMPTGSYQNLTFFLTDGQPSSGAFSNAYTFAGLSSVSQVNSI